VQTRADEDLDYEEEADYTAETSLKDKFRKYKGMQNFRTTEWDPYDNLPLDVFSKIYVFDNF
jgi:pre-rRNA-processing protein TSR1